MLPIIIIGHGGHGKTQLAMALRDNGLDFRDSSRFIGYKAVYPHIRETLGYDDYEQCFSDRANHRLTWKELIARYNAENPARLADEIFAQAPVYCGMRRRQEFDAAVAKYDPLVLWVDRSRVNHREDPSLELTPEDAHLVVDNNQDLQHLARQAYGLAFAILRAGQ